MSAFCKKQLIWKRVRENSKPNRFFAGPEFQTMFDADPYGSTDTISDTMPPNRIKKVHSRGVHTLVEFIPTNDTPYTGIFEGCTHAIMRISEDTMTTPEVPKTSPGHAIKFFRDGMHSANWLAMFSFDGQPSFNFFKNRWSSVLREPDNECTRATKMMLFARASDHPTGNSVMELS